METNYIHLFGITTFKTNLIKVFVMAMVLMDI